MTTKTTTTLSPIKRCYTSRRPRSILTNRKHQMHSPSTTRVKQISSSSKLPDLLNDIHIEQQRRETVLQIATVLRKVGDQIDEQLQINQSLSSWDLLFSRPSMTLLHCLSYVFL